VLQTKLYLRGAFVLLGLLASAAASVETLTHVLQRRGLTVSGQAIPNLDKPITGYEILDDEALFLIAYYVYDGSGLLREPLVVTRFDRLAQTWRSAEILRRDARAGPVDCFGSVTAIRPSVHGFYVGTHRNPSAGCTIVLTHDLAVQTTLYGWLLNVFGDGTVVYHNSQLHFAPTRYAEMSIYHPQRSSRVKIYPMKPYQRIRTEHINKVRTIYRDDNWCRLRNHHCDPERFDNFLAGSVEINNTTGALAFVIKFDNTVWQRRTKGVEAPEDFTEVAYIYRNISRGPIEYKEILLSDLKARFGDIPLRKVLEPAILLQIFGQ
jgi:hypothetical protein